MATGNITHSLASRIVNLAAHRAALVARAEAASRDLTDTEQDRMDGWRTRIARAVATNADEARAQVAVIRELLDLYVHGVGSAGVWDQIEAATASAHAVLFPSKPAEQCQCPHCGGTVARAA